jgi:hypothetical protein
MTLYIFILSWYTRMIPNLGLLYLFFEHLATVFRVTGLPYIHEYIFDT